jgi:hypothetical protein
MAGRSIGRKTEAKRGGKEAVITEGGIETNVAAFFNGPFGTAPFSATYGEHKTMGSENAPIVKGGRGAKTYFRGKMKGEN